MTRRPAPPLAAVRSRCASAKAQSAPRPRAGEAGFSLPELLVSAALMAVVMTLALAALDLNAAVSRTQTGLSYVQHSLRTSHREVQRMVRLAGRGGLPRAHALLVSQNVGAGTRIGGEDVVSGTDVLTLRGAFFAPIYQVDAAEPGAFVRAGTTATLVIDSVTRSGFAQPLDALRDLVEEKSGSVYPEPILLVGRQGPAVYAVVELAGLTFSKVVVERASRTREVERATLTLHVSPTSGEHTSDYLALSAGGGFPVNLSSVLFATVLEEYRFYIREARAMAGDPSSRPSPKLARARMLPGTGVVHPRDPASDGIDIADDIFDLQVALGIDLDGDGSIAGEDEGGKPLAAGGDEWLWNDAADDEALAWADAPLAQVRLTLLGQSATPDRTYVSPALTAIENHVYAEPQVPMSRDLSSRRHRRRLLRSTVGPRNL